MSEIEIEERVRETSLRDLYFVLFRHKWKMILFFFAVFTTVAIGTFLAAKIYRSEAKLLVRLGRESVTLDPTAATGQVINISQSRENQINSELEILKSQELLEKVVDSIGPEVFLAGTKGKRSLLERLNMVEPLSDRDKLVLILIKDLELETLKKSSIISISYEAKNPELAQQVVAKLIDLYLEKHIAVYQTPGSHRFFTQQTGHLRDSLTQSENELWKLKNETGIASVEKQRQILLDRIGALEQGIESTDAELASSKAKVEELQKTLQPTLLAERAILSSLKAKVETQKKQLVDARAELRTLNKSEVRLTQLTREISIQETNYRKYSENLEQARIDNALESERISNISVVQAATFPIKAVRPRKLLNLALGFFLGILGAIGLAFIAEYLDHSIKTPEDAEERLQLTTLVSIPRMRGVSEKRVFPKVKQQKLVKAGGKNAKGASGQWIFPAAIKERCDTFIERLRSNGSKETVPVLATTGEIVEHYEAFRERLLCSNGHTEAPYVLAVVGCSRHEGVSTVAANLATTLSRHDNGHVLLVDADVCHPSVHQTFKAKLSPGLTDILANGQSDGDIIQSLPAQNLHILSAGATNGNFSEIFDSDGFTKLLTSIKNHYHFVVIDAPALNDTSFATSLVGLCDGVVLVVEAERLRWEVAQRAKEQLVKSDANVLGVVLNKRQFHIPEWLYRTL